MLHRFREAQAIELGLLKKEEKRPYLATLCDNVKDCEYWRKQIIKEISAKVSKIQDGNSFEWIIIVYNVFLLLIN